MIVTLTKRSQTWVDKLKNTGLALETERFLKGEKVEVGCRRTCGSTKDPTLNDFEIWQVFIKTLKAQKVPITQERVQHDNKYATSHGGFWESSFYQMS